MPELTQLVGVVVIGRNEGQRLLACLATLAQIFGARTLLGAEAGAAVVYVDSGSTDGSVTLARACGAEVVELDVSQPFSAARARNAGLTRLVCLRPDIKYVQFLDGDCVLIDGWLEHGVRFLETHPDYAVVCGRVRERFRDASVYNRLMDLEWDTPVGDSKACGGIAMMRVQPFQQAQGFNPSVVAGEEPELCVRLRRAGWRVMRLDCEMTLHDAAMTRFGQWWKRSLRAGYAFALGASIHGGLPERHWVRESRRALVWGLLLPLGILLAAIVTQGWSLLASLAYPIQILRVASGRKKQGQSRGDAWIYALFCMIAKFPEAVGIARFYCQWLRSVQPQLIEYKSNDIQGPVTFNL